MNLATNVNRKHLPRRLAHELAGLERGTQEVFGLLRLLKTASPNQTISVGLFLISTIIYNLMQVSDNENQASPLIEHHYSLLRYKTRSYGVRLTIDN